MLKNRSIKKIIPARMYDMGDIRVRQPLPSAELDYLDPFVLLHHAHVFFDESMPLERAGVGPHPHRGFAPVTFVFKGGSHHRDSRGNDNKVYAGGTQWMNAGMGIMHSERPLEHEMEIVQMWVNVPKKHKKDQPSYYPLAQSETEQYISEDGLLTINIIVGELLGKKGGIPTLSPINAYTIYGKAGGKIFIPIPSSHNIFLYLLDGLVQINDGVISGKNFIQFEHDGEGILIALREDTRCLLMSGEPIGEKIVAQGPFVMNSEIEIMEAYRDYRVGKMGFLIED